MILFFRIYRHVELTIILKNPHRQYRVGQGEKSNDSEMAPQDFEIAQNGLGNGAGGVSGHGQRKVAQKRT
jgi:hypothetical protein